MPVSPAREVAYQILRRVESGRDFAADLLQSKQVSKLRDADRRLATELVMGVLRRRGELDFWIERISGKPLKYFDPEILTVLRMGVYQLRFLDRVPESAVVNEAVELAKAARKRSASGFVNAVLRKCVRPPRALASKRAATEPGALPRESAEAALRSLPTWIAERWRRRWGSEATESLARASAAATRTILRIRGSADEREEVRRSLSLEGVATLPARFASHALFVASGSVQATRSFLEGQVVIQDEASQLVASLLAPQPGQSALDLCAAPGIKTSQIAEALGRGILAASDVSVRRLRTMRELLSRFGPTPAAPRFVRLDAARPLPFGIKFDRILVDVPCSGTGTLARNPEIKWRLRPEDLARLAELQAAILRNALAVLAPGGRLVYATCSLEPEENERVVERVLPRAVESMPPGNAEYRLVAPAELILEFPALSPFFDSRGYFRTRPDLHSMDGFFAAVIVRAW